MVESDKIYHYARISATVGAGIFTGLALSAPAFTVGISSALSPLRSLNAKAYQTDEELGPKDKLTVFKRSHQGTGAVAIPIAIISGTLYAVAAYFSPLKDSYNSKFIGRGAGDIASRQVSDSVLTRATAPRALLIGSAVALFAVIPISSTISEVAARKALQLGPRLTADSALNTASGGLSQGTESQKQLDKQLAKWAGGVHLAALAGLAATIAGAFQLAGHSVTD